MDGVLPNIGDDLLKNLNSSTLKEAREKIMEILNGQNMSDDLKTAMKAMLGANKPLVGHLDQTTAFYVGLTFAGIVASVLLFFGYKLYKSIKDKELKREEKKKAKQMKKKK